MQSLRSLSIFEQAESVCYTHTLRTAPAAGKAGEENMRQTRGANHILVL